jgi:hypothetical protein
VKESVDARPREDLRCSQSHFATIVEAQEDVEVYQHGDLDCPACLRCMVDKHGALVDMFRARLAKIWSSP